MRHRRVKHSAAVIGAAVVLSFCSLTPPVALARGGHFGGGHFGGGHFGGAHFGGGHFGGAHFGGGHFGGRHFGGGHFGGAHVGMHMNAHRFSAQHLDTHASLHADKNPANHGMALSEHAIASERLARFHGFHGMQPHGFNRNAFGGEGEWNHWASGNWGAGWNQWGSGWGFWAGPVFWPFLYGDALSFVLWPDDVYDSFFGYGPDYLLSSIFWPGPMADGYAPIFDVYGAPPEATNYYGYYHRRHRQADDTEAQNQATCNGLAPGMTDLPIDQITRVIKPTADQQKILNDLQTASTKADSILSASCPSEVPLTPVGRLSAVSKRLHAMKDAVDTIRGPLTALDNSLDDQQREHLAAFGGRSRYRNAGVALSAAPGKDLEALCKDDTDSFTKLPVERIKDIVKPTSHQQSAFDALQSAAKTAASNLDSSCPYDMPETVADRLDAVGKRLDALSEAVTIIKPPLTRFYDALSDEQKARFNVIGPDNADDSQETSNR